MDKVFIEEINKELVDKIRSIIKSILDNLYGKEKNQCYFTEYSAHDKNGYRHYKPKNFKFNTVKLYYNYDMKLNIFYQLVSDEKIVITSVYLKFVYSLRIYKFLYFIPLFKYKKSEKIYDDFSLENLKLIQI